MAYYASYFTVRADGFDAATMLVDPETCRAKIREIKNMDNATAKDKDAQTALELVLEMNMRGIHFLPVDLYKSDARKFLIEDGAIRCPFTSLGGLGESLPRCPLWRPGSRGPSSLIEDLKERGKVGNGVIELLRTHGALEGMSETSQLCMF